MLATESEIFKIKYEMNFKMGMNRLIKYGIIVGLICGITFFQCNKKSTSPEEDIYPDSLLSYSQHILPIFEDHCAISGCHAPPNPQKGLDLSRSSPNIYNSNSRQVIFPNDAENSPLYLVLIGQDLVSPPMPYQRGSLSEAKIRAIKTWINEGAFTNN
ncbi:MAG: hypothetical protein Kow0042_29620 [Calditrichia bacterium]